MLKFTAESALEKLMELDEVFERWKETRERIRASLQV
jgi:hypothetical protein